MIKIYGSPKSSAGRVYWLLEEIGLKYERVPLNMRDKEHKSEAYLKINPNGKVPTLQDGDYTIWESIAINHYICDKHAPALLGTTSEIRGQVQQWSTWAMIELQKPLIDIFIQKVFVPDERRDHTVIEKAEKLAETLLKILNTGLQSKKYIAGDVFTVADINIAAVIMVTNAIQMDISAYKNIQMWLAGVVDRPSFKKYSSLE
ncbi:MAG: glutathione S-transferase family protein [Pseudobdellovibrio sp.]